ncbi:MAG: response regulator, partial [Patescibacteria group bacterium]|nr:response regulator [Patescibacteria group bacterium]
LTKEYEGFVVVIDDSAIPRRILSDGLSRLNIPHDTFESGTKFVERIKSDPSYMTKVSLIITDIEMDGILGFEVIQIVKEKHPEVSIVGNTTASNYKKQVMEVGADGFYAKMDFAQLQHAVDTFLKKKK